MEIPNSYALTYDVWMIPCKIEPKGKSFKPLIKPLGKACSLSTNNQRKYWTREEDNALADIIKKIGAHNWSSSAKELNIKFHDTFNFRNGKQCRERWLSNLDPNLIKSKWSKEEDRLLYAKHEELGNRWGLIKGFFTGRSESQVKNRWKILTNKKKNLISQEKRKFDFKENLESKDEAMSEYSLEDIDTEKMFGEFEFANLEPARFDWGFVELGERVDENFFCAREEDRSHYEEKTEEKAYGMGLMELNFRFLV